MDLRDTIDKLKSHIVDYLAMHGHMPNEHGKYNCPNPSHRDTSPSASIIPGTSILKCFGACNRAWDVIHLANWFEALPTHGHEFLTHTLPNLCAQFQIEYIPPEMTEEDLYKYNAHRAYKDATVVLMGFGMQQRLADRLWPQQACESTFTGAVTNWDDFVGRMRKLDYTKDYLRSIDITDRIFNENTIVFTWCNRWGDPVGFSARDVRVTDNKSRVPKYVNTSSKSPTFDKGANLYGIHWAMSHRPLTIVEGFPDVLTPYSWGVHNLVSLGGISLTDKHLQLLKDLKIDNIVLALDGDQAGIENTIKYLDQSLAGKIGVNVQVLDMSEHIPQGIKPDPDNFFKYVEDPKTKWSALVPVDAFKWRLQHFPSDTPATEVVSKALPLVINERNNVKREDMIRIVSEVTGYRLEALQRDLDNLVYHERLQVREEVGKMGDDLSRIMRGQDTEAVIERIIDVGQAAQTIKKQFSAKQHTVDETLQYMDELTVDLKRRTGELLGLRTGYPIFDDTLSGMPKNGRFIGIAGDPSSGKSSYMHQLIWRLLDNNTDFTILLFTIDDNRQVVFPRLVSIDTNLATNRVLSPSVSLNQQEMEIWNRSWDRIRHFVQSGNIDVRDSSQGNTVDFLESWIRHVRSQRGYEHPIIVFLDNFHKLEGMGSDERIKYKNASQRLHRLKTELNVTFVCSMELIKHHDNSAGWDHVAETRKLLYDCDVMIHIHEYMQYNYNTDMFWNRPDGAKMPIVKAKFWKNKVTGKYVVIWYEADTETSRFAELQQAPPNATAENEQPGVSAQAQRRQRTFR